MSLLAIAAAFLGGYLAAAGAAHRRARLDYLALALLERAGTMYGLDFIREGVGHQGTVYVRLRRLEEDGLIAGADDYSPEVLALRGGRPRRIYTLTEAGRAALVVERSRGSGA